MSNIPVEVVADKGPEPLDLKQIARDAAKDFGLSLKDDPTYWTHPQSITAEMVLQSCTEAAREMAASAVSQKLGKLIEAITASVDLAYSTDGAMADFDAVIATYAVDLSLDFSTWPGDKAPWDLKIMAVRAALNAVLTIDSIGEWLAPITVEQLLEYANKDERLHVEGLRKSISALTYPGSSVSLAPDDPGPIPEFMKRNKQENTVARKTKTAPAKADDGWDTPVEQTVTRYFIHPESSSLFTTSTTAEAEAALSDGLVEELDEDQYKALVQGAKEAAAKAGTDGWDEAAPSTKPAVITEEVNWDEPAPEADPWAEPPPDNRGVRGASHNDTGMTPRLCAMIDLAGISNNVMAVVMSTSMPYYSMIKSGKRKFPGITPEQQVTLRTEIDARREALAALEEALDLGELTKPGV